MKPEEFMSLSACGKEAMLVAVFSRNGVEDLHARGAFSDAQSPCLNRLFRQEAYQVTFAVQRVSAGGADRFVDYLVEVAQDGHPSAEQDMRLQCLSGSTARAIDRFAEEQDIDERVAVELAHAAQLGVLDQGEADGFMSSPMGLRLFFSLIKSWEKPEFSAGYRARFELS